MSNLQRKVLGGAGGGVGGGMAPPPPRLSAPGVLPPQGRSSHHIYLYYLYTCTDIKVRFGIDCFSAFHKVL